MTEQIRRCFPRTMRVGAVSFLLAIGTSSSALAQDAGTPKVDVKPVQKKPTTDKKPDENVGKDGKLKADTDKLTQFEQTMEFEPRGPNYKVAFSLEDADLAELVKTISNLTGKRFIFGAKVKSNIKANIYSPQKITVAEAYQAFLSILEANGLTVVPMGRFMKIIESTGAASQGTPISRGATTGEDRYVTRMHRLKSVGADEVATLLKNFQSKDANLTVYGPGNMLIITDTGSNIRRMMQIVEEIDVGGAGDQIWIEPIHYASATEVANRINELFDVKGGAAPKAAAGGAPASVSAGGGDLHVAKVLPDDRTGTLIIVATEKAYLRMLELIKKIDVPQSTEGEIHVIPLQHADAKELAKTLDGIIQGATAQAQGQKPAGGGGAPAQGVFEGGLKVSADEATNSLIVTSSLRDYGSLRAVIDKLDQSRRQVFIEAVIMDLSVARSRKLGVDWHGGAQTDLAGTGDQSLLLGGLNPLTSAQFPASAAALQGLALGIRGPGIPGTEALAGGTGLSIPAFGIVLNALATSTDTDILSTPHILATDNIQAEINIGKDTPTQGNLGLGALGGLAGAAGAAGAAGGAAGLLSGLGGLGGASVPRAKVGTKIKIKPHLNDSNEVRLEVEEEISDTGEAIPGNAAAIPIFLTTAKTNLIVQDQQTVVIGGLIRNKVSHGEAKIPLLGDIPLLGALFRTNTDTIQKSNLILILTPYIIRDTKDLRRVFEQKMRERQEFLDRYFVFSPDQNYQPPKDYSRTNGLLEVIRKEYRKVDEQRKLEEIARPRELKEHKPSLPLEMPATIRPSGASSTTQPATDAPPPTIPVRPSRSIRTVPTQGTE